MRVSEPPRCGSGGVPAPPSAASVCTRAFQTPKIASQTRRHTLFPVLSPPPPSPGNPPVIPVLNPPDRRNQVQRTEHKPHPAQLPQHPTDPGCPLKPPPARLDRPRRPIDLRPGKAQRLDQTRLLVRPRLHAPATVVPLHPLSEPSTE